MVGSRDLAPSTRGFGSVFFDNQFRQKPQWPAPGTDLSGRTAIVTGSNTGLGFEASRQLLGLGLSRIILAVRNIQKGDTAAAKLRQKYPGAQIEVWQLDMSSYESIQAFVLRTEEHLAQIDYVLLNAGMTSLKYCANKNTGHAETIQVNYISTMLLALLLLPVLKAKSPPDQSPHLTITSAALTLAAKFPNRNADPLLPSFDDAQTYDPQEHYNSSKLIATMFLWKLSDHVFADDVIVNLADPAWCKGTELAREVSGPMRLGLKLFETLGRTPEVGASCLVDALVNKGPESHCCFLMSWKIHPFNALLYTDEGKLITERVWKETLDELEFAGVRKILESMKQQSNIHHV